VRVVLQATDVPTGNVIVRASQEAPANADLRETFDALSVRLLEPAGVPAGGLGLAALTTRSVDAYRAYLRGVELYHRSAYRRAVEAFSEAVRLDSTFALAWASVALVSVSAGGFQETLNPNTLLYRAIDRAVRHSDQLPADQVGLIRVDKPVPEYLWREVMDTVSKHLDAVRAISGLAPWQRCFRRAW
jgi:hypothetical protein